jgi:hypothetical protein
VVVRSGRERRVGVVRGFALAVKLYGRQFSSDTARAGEGGAGSRTHREVVETVARE